MKKFLVPTDFSETSKNAALYAAQLAAQVPGSKVILIYVSDKFTGGSDGSPLTENKRGRRAILEQALQQLKKDMLRLAKVDIDFALEEGTSLVETSKRFVRHHGIHMVIMGITGATRLEQLFIGSNTLDMVDAGVCPVMIIPPNAKFRPIKNIMFTCDFKDVATTVPVEPLRSVLDMFNAGVHVVNVDSEHYVDITDEYKAEKAKLEKILQSYTPEFYFIRQYDFLDAVSQFATDKNIDVIVSIPKEKSFLSGLFKTSHTKKLAYHSTVPIIAIHE